MAFQDDLRGLIENCLLAFDSTIDLSPGSPAESQIVDPIVSRFADDPFATDLPTFFQDLMTQTFPELVPDNGGLLGDLLVKPFQLILEPFKREIALLKINQSVRNASIMSDDEADALGANFFEPRSEGGFAGGSVRLYFAQPTTQRVTPDKRVFTASGLAFFPTESFFITSAQMLFNRQGTRYFLDITVKAETQGDQYNIKKGDIIGIEDVAGVVQVTNLADYTDGAPRDDNETYLGSFDTVLTERSLVTRRGIQARVPKLFDSVRALSIIGAGDVGMDRDILTGTGEGFLHMAGRAAVYGDWLFVSEITYKDDGPSNDLIPQTGDTIRFHPQVSGSVTGATSIQTATIVSILGASGGLFLFLLDKTFAITISPPVGRFALLKPGFITISGVPGGQTANLTVPDEQVHLGGHTDVFVRPMADVELNGTLASVTDGDPLLALTDVAIPSAGQNIISSQALGQSQINPRIGDLFIIETGTDIAGTYRILEVGSPDANSVRVDSIFSSAHTAGDLRARIVQSISVNLVEPRIPKLPFDTGSVSDLNTIVGSSLLTLDTVDIQSYGATIGDVIRILDGSDAGDFAIIDFDSGLGGKGPIVDRPATNTAAGLRYEVFTAQTGLQLPLVRLKSLDVLDSTQQSTGISVPYGDAVDVRSLGAFEGAGKEVKVLDKQMIIFPDLSSIWGDSPITPFGSLLSDQRPTAVISTTDARFTQNLEIADGIVRRIPSYGSNPITSIEVNLPPFCWDGRRDKLLVLPNEADLDIPSTIAGTHQTSEMAKAKIGDTLTIINGPNQGSYVIKDKRVLDLWGRSDLGHREVTLLQVDPELPSDPLRTAINLIKDTGGVITASDLVGFIEWATDFDNGSGYYVGTFLPLLRTQLATLGVSFASVDDLKTFFDPLIKTGYSVGPAARGDFRLYFLDPVSVEFYFTDNPTMFVGLDDSSKVFRIDPTISSAQIFPEAEEDTPPTQWSRALDPDPTDIGISTPQNARLVGGSFPLKGVRAGDMLEFHSAIDDLPARPNMSSSWMAITQTGSNIVRLAFPNSFYVGNYTNIVPGQLLFIDSGPDIGAYVITSVEKQDWGASPPDIRVRLDKTLTHTTSDFPLLHGFDSFSQAFFSTDGNVFPMSLNGKILAFNLSIDGGVTFPTTVTHTFGSGPFPDIASVVSACSSNLESTGDLTVFASGDELVVRSTAIGPTIAIRLAVSSTAVDTGLLQFPTPGAVRKGAIGAIAVPGTKRIYGSTLPTVGSTNATVYAAQSDDVLGLPSGTADDTAYLGTFQITNLGVESDGPMQGTNFIELNRSDNFPGSVGDLYAAVKWFVHTAPTTPPSDTSDGGKEISDQFVRFRLYDAIARRVTITGIPWAASPHPLDPTSIDQITASSSLVPSGVNYGYKNPFRVLRPGVRRFSSTAMALQREGALYFMDLPVVGIGPGADMNIPRNFGFKISGGASIAGYLLSVKDQIFTYSAKEQVSIILPKSVLPVGSTPGLDNEFNLAGQNIQVTYNNAPLVDDIQRFFDSPQDRILVANQLVRHFLPSYVFLDAFYTGGSSVDIVAKDVIDYINNISPDRNVLEASQIVNLLKKRGAVGITLPITLIALTHGTDRRIRGMRSEDNIGADNVAAFEGSFNQSYFISGPDTSQEPTRPDGEQVFLKRT